MPIKFTTTSTGGGKKKRGKKQSSSSPVHTQSHRRTHTHKHTKGRRGRGYRRARAREGEEMFANARWRLGARGASARGMRAGSAARPAMMVAAGWSPFSCGGAAVMQSPGPDSAARLLPAFPSRSFRGASTFRAQHAEFFLYLLLSDSSLLCAPTRDGVGTRVGDTHRRVYV